MLTAVEIADTKATQVLYWSAILGLLILKDINNYFWWENKNRTLFASKKFSYLHIGLHSSIYSNLFLQLYEVFCKYAKEHPNLGMTPTEFAEFLYREQEASRM